MAIALGSDGLSLPLISGGVVPAFASAVNGSGVEEAERGGGRIWERVQITTKLIPTMIGSMSEETSKRRRLRRVKEGELAFRDHASLCDISYLCFLLQKRKTVQRFLVMCTTGKFTGHIKFNQATRGVLS